MWRPSIGANAANKQRDELDRHWSETQTFALQGNSLETGAQLLERPHKLNGRPARSEDLFVAV